MHNKYFLFRNLLCIGTPSIHEVVQGQSDIKSLLLDYDDRHHQFYQPDKFLWYNMFNNYLLNGESDEKILKKFIRQSRYVQDYTMSMCMSVIIYFVSTSSDSGLCVVMDPPFGGRVEALVYTLQKLNETYKKLCNKNTVLPMIWAFPYFSEPYIQNMMPDVQMHDYQVYNHIIIYFQLASCHLDGNCLI